MDSRFLGHRQHALPLIALFLCLSGIAGRASGQTYDVQCEKRDYGRRLETPPFTGDLTVSADIESYVRQRCFLKRFGLEGHGIIIGGKPPKAVASIWPEYGAMNLTEADLLGGGRVVAEVRVRSNNQTGVNERKYAEGRNFLFVGRIGALGQKPPLYILHATSPTDATWVAELVPPEQYDVEYHGHDPRTGEIYPRFSSSVQDCSDWGRRACFIDSDKVQDVTNFLALGQAGEDPVQGLSPAQWTRGIGYLGKLGVAVTSTGTWVMVGGMCICQGTGCH